MEFDKILETIHMISDQNLDVSRAPLPWGISLLDCIDSDSDVLAKRSTIRCD